MTTDYAAAPLTPAEARREMKEMQEAERANEIERRLNDTSRMAELVAQRRATFERKAEQLVASGAWLPAQRELWKAAFEIDNPRRFAELAADDERWDACMETMDSFEDAHQLAIIARVARTLANEGGNK